MTEITTAEASRIKSHMNKDHGESLGHYLEYFGRKTPSLAYSNPRITEFGSESMTIGYDQNLSWTCKFTPPMQAGQARVRLEQMHREAKEGLGISDVVISRVHLSASAWVSILLCLALNVWLLVTPASSIAHTLRWQAPMLRTFLQIFSTSPNPHNLGNAIKVFWIGALGIAHFVEIFAYLNPLLRRYNVKNPLVRVVYAVCCQIGGFPVWQSLRDEGLRQESKEGKTH
ncbi:hypothetical protein JCM3765_005392 [Sporobolomyces pararoseus]